MKVRPTLGDVNYMPTRLEDTDS